MKSETVKELRFLRTCLTNVDGTVIGIVENIDGYLFPKVCAAFIPLAYCAQVSGTEIPTSPVHRTAFPQTTIVFYQHGLSDVMNEP